MIVRGRGVELLKRFGLFLLSSLSYIARGSCKYCWNILLDGVRFASGWVLGLVLGLAFAITFLRELLGIVLTLTKFFTYLVRLLLGF